MQQVKLKDVWPGDFFKRKADAHKVYVRGPYDRTDKRYECSDFDDVNRSLMLKGETLVWVGFSF